MYKSSLGQAFRNSFAETIFAQKYRHEGAYTWEELSSTVVEDVCRDNLSREDKAQLTQYISSMKFIPGGRYLYYAGRNRKYFNNCLSGDTKFLTHKGIFTLKSCVDKWISILSPVSNTWQDAKVEYFGKQQINKITFSNLRGRSNKTWIVNATENHRWPLKNGEITETLKVGDLVSSIDRNLLDFSDRKAILHGMVFADGNVHKLKNSYAHQLRLCGHKSRFRAFFEEDHTITYPQFANGDPVIYIKSDFNMKELPTDNDPIEYIIGFIRGWLYLDGHISDGVNQIHSISKEAIELFIKYAPYCGYVVSGEIKFNDAPSNFGERQPLYWVNFSHHFPGFKVVSIEPKEIEDVYCVVEPKYHQFFLEHGIATGNCYLFKSEEDSREDWANLSWKSESCLTTGGGIGNNYSIYRGRNSVLHGTGGQASGPVSKMKMINEIGREVMQGGSRRSAIYASLIHNHSDIQEFLYCKDWYNTKVAGTDKTLGQLKEVDFNFPCPLDMTNISVNYDTSWLLKYWTTGEVGQVFLNNCKQAMMTGEPGFSFNFFDKEQETGRNACCTGDTLLLTKDGYHPISQLIGKEVHIWNGLRWSSVVPFSTGRNPIMKIIFSDGTELRCTPYHKFILAGNIKVCADELAIGDRLEKFNMPVSNEGKEYDIDAYSQGFYSGDGNKDLKHSYVYWPKYCCVNRLIGTFTEQKTLDRITWKHGEMFPKDFVPINGSLSFRLNWLAGICDSDGTVTRDDNGNGIQITSINKKFLQDIKLMLSRTGVRAKICIASSEAGYRVLPNGKGDSAEYWCQKSWRLLIGNTDTFLLKNLGFQTERLDIHSNPPQRDARRFIRVVDIQEINSLKKTYCVTEPYNNTMTINGIVTGNCTEVTTADDSDVCNLGSLNLSRITDINELKDVVELATKFLICGTLVAELPYPKIYDVREKNRRLGLGIMGLHEWMIQRGHRYEVTKDLHRWLTVYSHVSRNTANVFSATLSISNPIACRAIAPTGSIGILAGTTTGIEPVYAVAVRRRYLKGTSWRYQYVVDGTAREFLDRYGTNPERIESSMDLAKDYERRIKVQADVQDYVDMSISSTINLPSWGTEANNEDLVKDFAGTLAKYAHRLRGFTVYPDGARGGQPLTSVPYAEAIDKLGIEIEENTEHFDVCEITGGGHCGT